jgi:hypothetical protein
MATRMKLACLALCIFPAVATAQERISLTPTQEAEMQLHVSNQLNDPESARFRDVKAAVTKNGKLVVCGEINAKNRMGGYAGYHLFTAGYGVEKPGLWTAGFADENNKAESTLVRKVCQEVGLIEDDRLPNP